MRNVFSNDELPKYDDLFPKKITNFTNKVRAKRTVILSSSTDVSSITSADSASQDSAHTLVEGPGSITSDTEDIFQKFFHQRKNIQSDKMLLFVWLPLLVMMLGYFVLLNAGWQFEFKDTAKEVIRKSFGTVMLGNDRFKLVLNKHLDSAQYHSVFTASGVATE